MKDPLAKKGHFVHVYDFRVKPGRAEAFIEWFEAFDHSGENPMHRSDAQVKDGVLCQDVNDPEHFYLLGEWTDVEAHRAILEQLTELTPDAARLVEGERLVPRYARVVA